MSLEIGILFFIWVSTQLNHILGVPYSPESRDSVFQIVFGVLLSFYSSSEITVPSHNPNSTEIGNIK